MTTFKVGDRVQLTPGHIWRRVRTYSDALSGTGTVVNTHGELCVWVMFDKWEYPTGSPGHFLNKYELSSVVIPYDPTQQGDKDDDI
jgi:hypothetical protein